MPPKEPADERTEIKRLQLKPDEHESMLSRTHSSADEKKIDDLIQISPKLASQQHMQALADSRSAPPDEARNWSLGSQSTAFLSEPVGDVVETPDKQMHSSMIATSSKPMGAGSLLLARSAASAEQDFLPVANRDHVMDRPLGILSQASPRFSHMPTKENEQNSILPLIPSSRSDSRPIPVGAAPLSSDNSGGKHTTPPSEDVNFESESESENESASSSSALPALIQSDYGVHGKAENHSNFDNYDDVMSSRRAGQSYQRLDEEQKENSPQHQSAEGMLSSHQNPHSYSAREAIANIKLRHPLPKTATLPDKIRSKKVWCSEYLELQGLQSPDVHWKSEIDKLKIIEKFEKEEWLDGLLLKILKGREAITNKAKNKKLAKKAPAETGEDPRIQEWKNKAKVGLELTFFDNSGLGITKGFQEGQLYKQSLETQYNDYVSKIFESFKAQKHNVRCEDGDWQKNIWDNNVNPKFKNKKFVFILDTKPVFWCQVSLDPGVVEIQTQPITHMEMAVEKYGEFINAIFTAAKFADLSPGQGGGHINVDFTTGFSGSYLEVREMLWKTDYAVNNLLKSGSGTALESSDLIDRGNMVKDPHLAHERIAPKLVNREFVDDAVGARSYIEKFRSIIIPRNGSVDAADNPQSWEDFLDELAAFLWLHPTQTQLDDAVKKGSGIPRKFEIRPEKVGEPKEEVTNPQKKTRKLSKAEEDQIHREKRAYAEYVADIKKWRLERDKILHYQAINLQHVNSREDDQYRMDESKSLDDGAEYLKPLDSRRVEFRFFKAQSTLEEVRQSIELLAKIKYSAPKFDG